MSARVALAFVAGGVLGAGGMWLGLPRAPAPAEPPRLVEARPAPVHAPAPAVSLEDIRAVVRQELLAAAAATPARPAPVLPAAVTPPVPAEPREESSDTARPKRSGHEYADAQRLVEGGLLRRSWTVEDRSQLQALLPLLSPAERDSLTRQLIVAANRGELKVEVFGPLF